MNLKYKEIYGKLFPTMTENLKNELVGCNKVLDLGCGDNSLIQHVKVPYSVGVDLFEPYAKKSKEKCIHNKYIIADIREVNFKWNEFDAVICLDVIEHLTKEEGFDLIKKMETWARKKVIIYTPNGYIWQECFDENHLQEHKSGWKVKELRNLGFHIYGICGWSFLRGYKAQLKYKPALLWGVFSDITQKITYRFPMFAFGLMAVKMKNQEQYVNLY